MNKDTGGLRVQNLKFPNDSLAIILLITAHAESLLASEYFSGDVVGLPSQSRLWLFSIVFPGIARGMRAQGILNRLITCID